MLVLDDVTLVALAINTMSALFSALTVFITYHLIYRLAASTDVNQKSSNIVPMFSALCGSLCLAFSDSFWFSAVEAETYAAAAFFLMLLVWLIVTGRDLPVERRAPPAYSHFLCSGIVLLCSPDVLACASIVTTVLVH